MPKILLIETSVAKLDQAKTLVKTLLDKRLIACGNIHKIESTYNWGNQEQNEEEYKISLKTLIDVEELCQEIIQEIHPYRVPMILTQQVSCNQKYSEWVKEQINPIK